MVDIVYLILMAFAVLITLTVHEYCHGYAAYKLGDPTAKSMGRLTLNPIKHIDPLGALCMLLFRFGWAKPVPIDTRYLKNPRRDVAIISLAGPLSNLILSFIAAIICLSLRAIFKGFAADSAFTIAVIQNTEYFFMIFHLVNIGIAIFNLIPVPPLDGSNVLGALLPPRAYYAYSKHERTLYFVLIGWLLLGDYAKNFLMRIPLVATNPLLSLLVGLLSLSDIIGLGISSISDGMFKLLRLIPFFR